MEKLDEFRRRTRGFTWNSLPDSGMFETNQGLAKKVDDEGRMKPYYGDTVVFMLDDPFMQYLQEISQKLYASCAFMLAEPLQKATFHLTLHDLVNGPWSEELSRRMKESGSGALDLLRQLEESGPDKICLRSTRLFNMVNTSVVLGFEPAEEESCIKLMLLYDRFQEVVPLSYPLTPHITIAYYRPGRYGEEALALLGRVMAELAWPEQISLELNTEKLRYQRFTDMNHYMAAETFP